MQAIHPTLASGQQGADIANLHVVLDKIEFGGPVTEQERADHRFDEGTAEAVHRLQAQFAIPAKQPGVVDEQTAEEMNRNLFETGVFRLVSGRVTNQDGSAIAGNLLFAFDKENIGGAYLGSDNTNAEGAYRIYYDPLLYSRPSEGVLRVKDVIDLVVQVYDAAGATLAESQPLHNPDRVVHVDLTVPSIKQPVLRVYGMARNEYGEPLNGVTVQAFDRELRSEELLGSTLTQAGHYEIRYKRSQRSQAENEATNLVLKVLDAAGKGLYKTPIQYNVPAEVEINIGLQGAEYKGPSEFEVLTDAFKLVIEDVSPSDLREDDQFQDISFLSGETGQSQLVVGTWVACHRLADKTVREETPLEAAALYGFMRQGQPGLLDDSILQDVKDAERVTLLEEKMLRELANIGPEQQQLLLEKALADNLIPARIKAQVPEILETLRKIKLRFAADMTLGSGKGTIGQLLDLTPAAKQAQTAFLATFIDHNGPINEFWKKLEQDKVLEPETVRQVKLTFGVGALTRNHIPLVGALVNMFQIGELQAKRDLAKYDRAQWISVFQRPGPDGKPIGVPANIDGNTDEAKLEQFAAILEQNLERSYPTTAFAAKLTRTPQSPVTARTDVVRFIENNPTFHLDRFRVDHYIAENRDTLS